jgi:hypothetical protein
VVHRPGQPDVVAFAMVDEDGAVGPERWTFGQSVPCGDPDDDHAVAAPFGPALDELPAADRELMRA